MEDKTKVTDDQKIRISAHWDSLKRFDSYISATNFKCGLITTFNAAVIGGVFFKLKEITITQPILERLTFIIASLVLVFSLLSILMVVRTIQPRLDSKSTSSREPSLFFFGSISANYTGDSYFARSQATTTDEIEHDLAIQVHEVATITSLKMKNISTAALFTSFNIGLLFLFGLTLIASRLEALLCQA